jgi:membrane protease YdiL (CAAX protease family)
VAVQALFACMHVPMLLEKGHHWVEMWSILPQLFVFGTAFALLYLATGNLVVAIGTHALGNAVVLVPPDPLSSSHPLQLSDYLYVGVALVAAIAWRLSARLR